MPKEEGVIMWGWIVGGVIFLVVLFIVIGWVRGGRQEEKSQSLSSTRRSLWDKVKDACCTRGK